MGHGVMVEGMKGARARRVVEVERALHDDTRRRFREAVEVERRLFAEFAKVAEAREAAALRECAALREKVEKQAAALDKAVDAYLDAAAVPYLMDMIAELSAPKAPEVPPSA